MDLSELRIYWISLSWQYIGFIWVENIFDLSELKYIGFNWDVNILDLSELRIYWICPSWEYIGFTRAKNILHLSEFRIYWIYLSWEYTVLAKEYWIVGKNSSPPASVQRCDMCKFDFPIPGNFQLLQCFKCDTFLNHLKM